MYKVQKKVSWYDLNNLHQKEIKQKYSLNNKELEHAVREHLDGANANERRQTYENVYNNRNKI